MPRDSLLYKFVEEYQKRVAKFTPITIIQPQTILSVEEISLFYQKEIKKLSVENPLCFALDENGKNYSSISFAKKLELFETRGEKMVIFCLGGAYGLPKELKNIGRLELFSLSALTFPHELALAVLFEQIYRAKCILSNHPYHHGEPSALIKEIKSK
ncbi:23S rRNA (pseudouridine(1915)-N(3))-methyltransferase RlmH [Pigmentibacter sp. JX0631]|uniref:23S rRNA (pseudouridine(1915)-N(3))-methyltransferase RlmH n=1 Tax=Pigmentibacter sp. JX0631 TaxID=2976982 RepID=UPI00246940F0|nr:23S rRNA (pseudouridine(1915)-N(3))-methyltransferase RlmH [Pigmentibacter sp. JX0631]WGL58720.1 23S rRNA (pseudouridine(1915)-N(3))-methyltransferase RlmH [Pigmentibacter sp. JX0631]